MSRMIEVTVSVGSNTPDRDIMVAQAIEWLHTTLGECRDSGIYSTSPLSGSGSDYSNAVVTGLTDLESESLNTLLKDYEVSHGRDSDARKCGKVTIDLDLVYYNSICLRPKDASRYFFTEGMNRMNRE